MISSVLVGVPEITSVLKFVGCLGQQHPTSCGAHIVLPRPLPLHRMEMWGTGERRIMESQRISEYDIRGTSAHCGHLEKLFFFFLEKSAAALTRRKRNGRRHIQNVPAWPQIAPWTWLQKIYIYTYIYIYQAMFFPSRSGSAWNGPQFPLEPNQGPVLGERQGGGNKTFVPYQPPRSHLRFYNPFSSQGRGKEWGGGEGRKGNQKSRSNVFSSLQPIWSKAIKLWGDYRN